MRSRLGLGLAALGLLRCGACGSESGGQPDPTGGDASLDAPSGGGSKADAAGGGGTTTDGPAGGGGSAGLTSDAGLSPEQAWLADPTAWQPVPGAEFTQPLCHVFEAVEGKIGFPKLVWQPCGSGCESTALAAGYGSKGAMPVATTYALPAGPSAFLTYDVWINAPTTQHYVRRVVRLEDGATVGALNGRHKPNAVVDTCNFGNGGESARANALSGGEPSSEMRMVAPISGGQWVWSLPAKLRSTQPIGLVEFDIDAKGGAMFMTGKGGVWALLDPKVTQWTPLETPSASSRGAGEGDLAVWTDYPASAPARIRGWAPDGKGVRTLFDPAPPGTCVLNVTPTAIVGIAPEGGGGCGKLPFAKKGRFWWSPRKYDASGPAVTLGPYLPGDAVVPLGVVPLRAWGDHVAAVLGTLSDAGALDGEAYFLITNTSTGKTWSVEAEAGHRIHHEAWTLTPTHFYYGDQEPADGPKIVRRMLRLELAKLDQVAKPQN